MALVLILVAAKSLIAQQHDINTLMQYFDSETSVPEEDIALLNEILNGRWSAGKVLADQIVKLSIIDLEDEILLKKIVDEKSFLELSNNESASIFLRELVEAISFKEQRILDSSNLVINQYIVFSDDNRYRWKINYNKNNYAYGVIAERDPNESRLLDHLSYYILKKSKYNELIIGDYQIVAGYGLWSWRSVSTRKSFESIATLPRMGSGVSPYRSANEYWYIRGINYNRNTKYGNFSLSGGVTKQDGNIDENGNVNISSSGLHTGESSIEQSNNITETLAIGQWYNAIKNSEIIASIAGVNWSNKTNLAKNDWCGSIAFNHSFNQGKLFSEFGHGYNNSTGTIMGLRLKYPTLMYLLSARYYSKGYSALRANPFAEWVGGDRNEIGIYQGIQYKNNRHSIILFGDLFKTNDIEGDEIFPTRGMESGVRWEWHKGREYQRFQWKEEKKSIEDEVIYQNDEQIQDKINNTYKYSSVYQINKSLWGKLQLTYSNESYSKYKSTAFGIATNVWLELKNLSVSFDLVTVFTNAGSAWIYFWDVNLPGEMTTRVYTKDSISPAMKILYQTDSGFEIGIRARAQWQDFDFSGTPDLYGALVLEILL